MALTSGTRLGPYEILSPLGAGGMGEVYRARDTRLERTVAIKILPEHLSSDPARRQRFEREAKTISNLNHPHICVLHDVGHQDGVDYLIMEYVEGETLEKRLEKGPLSIEQVVKIGAQVADALDRAHRSGVVHRDLKPGNIMLSSTGAKLLDFGLAKPAAALAAAATTVSAKDSPVTEQGTIAGTFQYMSPEQIEGKELDARSDIFSFGAVLYEMVTGRRAFAGKSQLSVASAILEKEPDAISVIKPMTPPALDRVVRKCLAKVADERWQSAGDLAAELKWIGESSAQTVGAAVPHATPKFRERAAWLIAGALALTVIAFAILSRNSKPPEQALVFSAPFPSAARHLAVAPNGHTIAVVSYRESARKDVLWIYELGSQEFSSLADTEGATYPFWSPDGRSLAFFAEGKLKKLELAGGPVQTICDAPSGRGGTWNKDGVIVFTPDAALGKGLYRVQAAGGTPTPISTPDRSRGEDSHRYPMFLPDGKHYLYMTPNFSGLQHQKGVEAIFVGSLDSNEKRFVVEADGNAAYAAPGYLVFYRNNNLLAQRFDLKRFALTGEPTTILTDVESLVQVKWAVFAVSDTGVLVAQRGHAATLSQPVWFDRNGKEVGAVSQPGTYGNVSIARNGASVAVNKTDTRSLNTDIWTYDLQRNTAKRLTFDTAFIAAPIWSPDARQLLYFSNQSHGNDLYMKSSDGAQEGKVILHDDLDKFADDWSQDGKYILYTRDTDLWSLSFPELKSRLFLKTPSVLANGQFSPDGRWVAYASNETGKWEIYVTSFPDAKGKWQVSTGGGEQPRWRGDGRELFYLASDSKMMAVPVATGANFDSGTPVALFQTNPRQPISSRDQFAYDVTRDGRRFLILTQVKQNETAPMSVVLNWPAKLNK
jgi:Tol biopolymer transport system component